MKAPKCFVELMMCNRKKSLHFLYPQRKLQISLEMNREKSWKMNNRNENSLNMFRCQGVRTTVFSRHSQSAHSTSNMNSLFIHLFNDLLSQFILIWYIIGYAICRIVTVSACERKVKNITSTTHTHKCLSGSKSKEISFQILNSIRDFFSLRTGLAIKFLYVIITMHVRQMYVANSTHADMKCSDFSCSALNLWHSFIGRNKKSLSLFHLSVHIQRDTHMTHHRLERGPVI